MIEPEDDRDVYQVGRATLAEAAFNAYIETADQEDEPQQQILGDLLSDMRHFCHLKGLDFDLAVKWAHDTFKQEYTEVRPPYTST